LYTRHQISVSYKPTLYTKHQISFSYKPTLSKSHQIHSRYCFIFSIYFSKFLSPKAEGFCTAAHHLCSKQQYYKLTGLTEGGNELSGTVNCGNWE